MLSLKNRVVNLAHTAQPNNPFRINRKRRMPGLGVDCESRGDSVVESTPKSVPKRRKVTGITIGDVTWHPSTSKYCQREGVSGKEQTTLSLALLVHVKAVLLLSETPVQGAWKVLGMSSVWSTLEKSQLEVTVTSTNLRS